MDAVDIELLRRQGVVPFLGWPRSKSSVAALAKGLGIGLETTRRRLKSLQTSGVLAGREIWPNFRHLGLRAATYHFRAQDDREKPVAKIAALPRVFGAYDMLGTDVCVDLAYETEAELAQRLRAIQDLVASAAPAAFFDYPLPPAGAPLQPLDWRIIAALRGRPERPLPEVAAELRTSARTVRRRLDAMLARGAVDLVGVVDPGALQGHFLVYLLLHLKRGTDAADTRAIANAFRGRWLAQWSPPSKTMGDVVLVCVARATREVADLRREAESLPLVAQARALLLQGAAADTAWIDAAIAERALPARRVLAPAAAGRG